MEAFGLMSIWKSHMCVCLLYILLSYSAAVKTFSTVWEQMLYSSLDVYQFCCSFYDFTMDETKRKYKWEAYTEQEKKWWLDTLNYFGDRIAGSYTYGINPSLPIHAYNMCIREHHAWLEWKMPSPPPPPKVKFFTGMLKLMEDTFKIECAQGRQISFWPIQVWCMHLPRVHTNSNPGFNTVKWTVSCRLAVCVTSSLHALSEDWVTLCQTAKKVWFCAVVVGFTAFIVAMPCSVLWTLVVPYLLAWKNLEHGKGLWPYFWVVLLAMQPLKHDISRPIRWLI